MLYGGVVAHRGQNVVENNGVIGWRHALDKGDIDVDIVGAIGHLERGVCQRVIRPCGLPLHRGGVEDEVVRQDDRVDVTNVGCGALLAPFDSLGSPFGSHLLTLLTPLLTRVLLLCDHPRGGSRKSNHGDNQ